MTTVYAAVAAALFGCGTYLVLHRELTRMLVGLSLLGHGANALLLLATRTSGAPAFIDDDTPAGALLDPLPQAFALTAIVITFAVTAFLLALAYRSWVLTHDDTIHDDPEDRRVAETETQGGDLIDGPPTNRSRARRSAARGVQDR